MNKPNPPAETSAESGIMSVLTPMQESFDRFRKASERLSNSYAEIAAEQANFLQRAFFDGLAEIQALRQTRVPAEFFEVSTEFAWQQAERSLRAFSELGGEVCSCWFEALKATPALVRKENKGRALH